MCLLEGRGEMLGGVYWKKKDEGILTGQLCDVMRRWRDE